MITSTLGPAEVITAGPLRAAGATVASVDTGELDTTLTTGSKRGREAGGRADRVHYGRGPLSRVRCQSVSVRASRRPVRRSEVAGQLMDQLAVAAQDDLAGEFTRNVPLPQPTRC